MLFKVLPCVAAVSAVFMCSTSAWAQQGGEQGQEDKDEAALPVVEVHAAQVRKDAPTITKLRGPAKDVPQSTTVIDRQRMEEQNLQTLEEVMQQTTGVTVQQYQLLTTGYSSRGFKIDSYQQDGVPILLGNTASPGVDMVMYDSVEVLRGANGLMQGAGNPGGAVNLVLKKPQRKFAASASVSVGSWDRYRAEADIGGPLNAAGTLRGRLAAGYEDRGYFYDVGQQQSANLYGVAELDLTRNTILSFGVQKQDIRSVTNMAGVPFNADGSDMYLPRSTYLDVAWDRFNWDYTRLNAGLEHQFDNGWQAKLLVNHLQGDANLKYAGLSVTNTVPRFNGAAYEFGNKQDSADVYASGPFSLLGRQHELVVGANYLQSESTQYTASFLTPLVPPPSILNWNPYSIAEPATGPFTTSGPTKTQQSGAYGVVRLSLADSLKLIIGGRVSQWKQETPTKKYSINGELTPYGGLVYALTPQWNAYVSYAQIFQPQTQMTAAEELIDPVKGSNYEAGIKGELAGGRLNVGVSAFRINQTNRAQQDPAYPCVTGMTCYYIASGEVRSEGFEAEVNGQITDNFSMNAGYTFNTTKYLKDATSQGKPFSSSTPKHMLRVWSNYVLPWQDRRLSAGLGVQSQSEYKTTSGNVVLRQGTYTLVNARLAYRINDKVSVAANINNLFDKRYYQTLSSTAWNNRYGEPRSITVSLRAQY